MNCKYQLKDKFNDKNFCTKFGDTDDDDDQNNDKKPPSNNNIYLYVFGSLFIYYIYAKNKN